jgi:GxxExxY protein
MFLKFGHANILKQEVYDVVGAAMEVHTALGRGLLEKPYENAMVVECGLWGIEIEQQKRFKVAYKDVEVGCYIPDLICFAQVIVELKTIESIANREMAQMLNYLSITGLQVGLLLNFKNPQLEWKRVVLRAPDE